MQKNQDPPTLNHPVSDDAGESAASREILIPHDIAAGPVTAIRNMILQASLTELKTNGHYDRYTKLIDPSKLEQLTSSLAPGWIPIGLALAHYEACEDLNLSTDEFEAMGQQVGERVQDAMLVSLAKKVRDADFNLWAAVGPLHRMWPRLFQGGSVQVVKVAPKDKLLEERGFRLNRYNYYRHGHVAALRATYSALGARIVQLNVVSYNAARDEQVVHVGWL
jgi:hypothetical protein